MNTDFDEDFEPLEQDDSIMPSLDETFEFSPLTSENIDDFFNPVVAEEKIEPDNVVVEETNKEEQKEVIQPEVSQNIFPQETKVEPDIKINNESKQEVFPQENNKENVFSKETVQIEETKKKRTVHIIGADGEEKSYDIPFGSRIRVNNDDVIEAGDEITEGSVNPHDIMNIKGIDGVRRYLLSEVQKVYRLQGVDINDKHLEVVVRQMTRKIKITDSGDTDLLPGTMIDIFDFDEANEKVREFGGEEAKGEQALLGITKAALATDSFLSAASFQETTRVLTDAAIKGKIDPLVGLKENVIIGKLIPAGTGMMKYRKLNVKVNVDDEEASKIITE